jgi:hypothetical protein
MTRFHVKVLTGFAVLLTLLAAGDLARAQSPGSPAAAPGVQPMAQSPRSPSAAPARDGNIAIQEELDAARRAGTREAYDLFIARHPDHPLAATAKQERERLAAKR